MASESTEPEPRAPADWRAHELERILQRVAHLLPAQGPISIFVHHNTLHSFEQIPFERAVVEAEKLFGCEPFLSEEQYRQELGRVRILEHDLEEVVKADLGPRALERPGRRTTRAGLRLVMLRHAIHEEEGPALDWLLAETSALTRFRADTPMEARRRLLYWTRSRRQRARGRRAESVALTSLWEACVDAVRRARPAAAPKRERIRPRDWLLAATGEDADLLVDPVLIRFSAAYLDQGIAFWPLPGRELGFYRSFLELYREGAFPAGGLWRELASEVARESRLGGSASDSALRSLDALGIPPSDREAFVSASLLALKGWAGMVHQFETRPDRVPVHAPPAKLVDFLAVRLLVERVALSHVARATLGYLGPLSGLSEELRPRLPSETARTVEERAYPFFQIAQIVGRTPDDIARLSVESASQVLEEIEAFSELERRRIFHLAYERRHRVEVLDALAAASSEPAEPPGEMTVQAVFCIDEREESLRRHLEEIEPSVRTYATAGFFGLAMYYRGAGEAHGRPLCPIAIRPEHEVEEEVDEALHAVGLRRKRSRRFLGKLVHHTRTGSRTLARGTLLAATLGVLSAVPLVFRVLFPRWTARLQTTTSRWLAVPESSRLKLQRDPGRKPALGKWFGFTAEEMAAAVRKLLEDTGLAGKLAPLVLVVGHGSSSLNNPHESAHDCGACGGGRGGPNARAFAEMANRADVRRILRDEGIVIPEKTIFVGAYHDTCDDDVTLFDVASLPEERAPELLRLEEALDRARALNAHERCRRFESAPGWLSPSLALAHVEARAQDLAQVRPEYGHATNAVCIVGRRSRTRGLFLDRRAFLVSYDPESDDARGSILSRVLASVIPVVAGISLEYYFSFVDPVGYGCGTKLPHNITGLIGVMNGYASDLRTGLPWQMVEIHEPVRLLVVVEAEPELLKEVVARLEPVEVLVQNRWIQLAALDPSSADIHLWENDRFVEYLPESPELPVIGASIEWYGGQEEHLPPARILPTDEGTQPVP